MARTCWCTSSPSTCPVHIVGKAVTKFGADSALFSGITPRSALLALRGILSELGVAHAEQYRTHDPRRGHARDLQKNGVLH